MQRLQAFLYELQLNRERQRRMRRFAGCRRFFNQALRLQGQRHEAGEKTLGYARFCKRQFGPARTILDQDWFEFRCQWGLQAAREVWLCDRRTFPAHDPHPCGLRSRVGGQPPYPGAGLHAGEPGLEENGDVVGAINVLRAGYARVAHEVSGATLLPAEGTHRSGSGSGSMPGLSALGIYGISGRGTSQRPVSWK